MTATTEVVVGRREGDEEAAAEAEGEEVEAAEAEAAEDEDDDDDDEEEGCAAAAKERPLAARKEGRAGMGVSCCRNGSGVER